MNFNKLTNEEVKILATGKLLAYCDDSIIIEPPCHAEIILDLFNSFNQNSRNGETQLEKLQNDFPNIGENELLDLIEYFKQVKNYCDLVCCAYAQKYPYPVSSKKNNEEQEDFEQVVKACRQRYPWLEKEYIESNLISVVYMMIHFRMTLNKDSQLGKKRRKQQNQQKNTENVAAGTEINIIKATQMQTKAKNCC